METNTIDLSKYYIGTVMQYNRSNRQLAVYIPELMPTLASVKYETYTVPTNNGLQLSNNNGVTLSINKSNALWVKAENNTEPLPDIGSNVIVYFLENNPTLAYRHPFYINNSSKIIEAERYPQHFTLAINNQKFAVNQDDTIQINLPPNYEVLISENNKTKTFNLNDRNTEYDSMKEQIDVLNQNNSYLLTILKRRIISEMETIITDGYSAFKTATSNSASDSLISTFTDSTYPNYINSLSEIHQLIDVDNCSSMIARIFKKIGNIQTVKTYYDSKSKSDKFADVILSANNQIKYSLDNYTNVDNQFNVLTALNDRICSLTRTVTFNYDYAVSYQADDGSIPTTESIPATLSNESQQLVLTNNLFEVIPTETMDFINKFAKPRYFGLNQCEANFTGRYTDTNLLRKFSTSNMIETDISLYPAFLGIEVSGRTVVENNGQYTITYQLQLINSANVEVTSVMYNNENITENMQIIISGTDRNALINLKNIKINTN